MAFGIQANEEELNYAIAVLNKEGELIWKSPLLTREPRLVYLGRECMVYRFSSEGDAPIAGFSDYFSVSLTGGSLNDPPLPLAVNRPVLSSYLEDHKTNTAFLARTSGASLAAGRRLIVQKWAPASPTPNLAPSTFGLEDGNLIISWPTAAGETYQVQRSMDLESWENIGVALTGNGTTMSYAQPSTADKVFLRVVIP
ncbi:MAG: hypothetical protein CL386_10070 [Acidiferrobacter sp.]|nr:hypothetical protein [Acidiferrobacter sp.]